MSLAGPNRKRALTAAASKIGYSRSKAGQIKEAPWQERAWQVYEQEGSIYFMTRYRSAVARKVDYFAAAVDSPGDDPGIDATYNDDGELLAAGPAMKVLEAEGGPELIRRLVSELMVHWDVPGEGYLTRFEDSPFWRILSTQELKRTGTSYLWGDDKTQLGVIDSDQVYRVWKAHPRFHWEADSPTKHILEDAEELILLRRELKARSQSRLPAGAWILPDTVDFTPFGSDGSGDEDDFARELTMYMTQAVGDPGSAAAQVPWILTVSPEDHAAVVGGFMRFDRNWEINLDQRDALLRSIATGLDVPPEVLTGMADLNHWSAWLVSEQAVSQHVAPTVDDILDSLTVNWFRPLLEASGVDPDGYVLWRDISPATVPPDKSDLSVKLFEVGAIGGVALRRDTDHDEEDAPTPEELEARRPVPAVEAPPVDGPPVQASISPDVTAFLDDWLMQSLRRLQEGDPPLVRAAVTAAARRRIVATELADLDAELLEWVAVQADLEIEYLINLALTSAVDPLDESMLGTLAKKLDRRIAAAQAAARGWLTRTLGREPSSDGEDLARAQGVAAILAGVLDAVRRKLFTPQAAPDPIDTGRIPLRTTPIEAIRHGLSLAGGGPAIYEDGKAAELIGNGQKVHDELAEDGFFQDGYEWKYGHPANTFEPHLHLDGRQFMSWDDPQLAVNFGDSWLRRSHYAPGDHKGCCCAFIQVIVKAFQPVEGRDTSAEGGGIGFLDSALTNQAGTLPGKGYAYTFDPKTRQMVKRATVKRNMTGADLIPEQHRAEVTDAINEVLDGHSPTFRVSNIEFHQSDRILKDVANYDSFGVLAGGKDKMRINVSAFFDENGNWRPEKREVFRDVIAHENAHRTESLLKAAASPEWARFEDLANVQMQALSREMSNVQYVLQDSTQMVYPVSIVRGLAGGTLSSETFSELVAFAHTNSLGARWTALRDAAQEAIDVASEFLGA